MRTAGKHEVSKFERHPVATAAASSLPQFSLQPEQALVVLCSRVDTAEQTRHEIQSLLEQNLDWDYIFLFARRHSTLPLVYKQLRSIAPDAVPPRQLARLKSYYQENAARNLFLTGELCRLLKFLESQGVEAIPYKGPALAVYAYGDLALRRFVDLDIMVRKSDVLRAKDILSEQGYVCGTEWTEAQQSMLLRTQHNLPLSREEGRLIVELHWEVASDLFASSLQAEQLWESLETMTLGNITVKTLSAEHLLLSLCVHGSRHLWERLAWICDVAELLKSGRELNWTTVLERAGDTGNVRMLLLGLFLSDRFFGAQLPAEVKSRIDSDSALNGLSQAVSKRLFSGTEFLPVTAAESFWYNMQIREGWRSRLRYGRLMFRPTDGDVATVSLPGAFSFAYYLVRPLRLLRSDRERRLTVQKNRQVIS